MSWQADLAARARAALHPAVWQYVEAGASDQISVGEAVLAWERVRFRPRVLRDVSSVSTAVTLLGHEYATAVGVAPTSLQRAVHPEGEPAMVRAAAAVGAPQVVSSNAGTPFASIGEAAGGAPWWLQVYVPPERGEVEPVLAAAAAAGASALVLTVDTPFPGPKPGADDPAWADVDLSWHRLNFTDPERTRWARDLGPWDIDWLARTSGLPVVVKGVLRPDDARRCVAAGAAAVWVSNHGGRQLDRAVTTADALPAVVAALGAEAEVYVDGGVRSGLDALAALALGARAVFVGRPALHGLAAAGEEGVATVLRTLTQELRDGLALSGCAVPGEAPTLVGHPDLDLGDDVL